MAQNMPFAKHIVKLVYINRIFFTHKVILIRISWNFKSFSENTGFQLNLIVSFRRVA